eukprot:scaffold4525_cov125-Isochrysis_galbana.AAC.11
MASTDSRIASLMMALDSWIFHGSLRGRLGGGRSFFRALRLREGSVRVMMRRGCGRTCSALICSEGCAGANVQRKGRRHCDCSAVGAKAALPSAAASMMRKPRMCFVFGRRGLNVEHEAHRPKFRRIGTKWRHCG